jgi:MFS family permease
VFSGTVVDLLGRRATAMASDLASALTVAAIPVLGMTVGLSVPAVAALAALGAVFDPAGVTARESMLPDAALHAGLRLQRANGVHEAVWGIAFLVGPGVGGLLIAVVGARTTMWATAAGFFAAVVLVAAARVPASGRPHGHDRPAGLLRGTADGLRFFWSDRLLRVLGLVSTVIVALYLPIEGVLLPTWFQEQGAPRQLGAVVMALSVGGIVGALAFGQWGGRVGRRAVYVAALIGTAVALIGMATLPPTPLLIAAAVVIGLMYGPIQPLVNLAAQTRTPPRLRGRVIGVLVAAEYAAGPVGYLAAGPAVDAFGIRPTFVGLAVAVLVVALGTLLLPSLHLLDGLPDAPPDVEGDLPATGTPPRAR